MATEYNDSRESSANHAILTGFYKCSFVSGSCARRRKKQTNTTTGQTSSTVMHTHCAVSNQNIPAIKIRTTTGHASCSIPLPYDLWVLKKWSKVQVLSIGRKRKRKSKEAKPKQNRETKHTDGTPSTRGRTPNTSYVLEISVHNIPSNKVCT